MTDSIPLSISASARLPHGLLRELEEVRSIARKFNTEIVRPLALEVESKVFADGDHLPWNIVQAAHERGFYSMWLPKAFGGGGYHSLSLLVFFEELASECLGIANLIGSHYVGIALVSASFNMKLLQRLSRDILEGEKNGKPCLVSTAITEPDAGTDLEDALLIDRGRVCTRAEKVSGGYQITGSKIFISNGHLSAWHLTTAYADLKNPSKSTVLVAVPTETAGFSFGRIERKLGQSACPASVLNFDHCFVPDENVCFAPDHEEGERFLDDVLAMSRPGVAIMSAGAAKGAYLETLRCLSDRELNGKPLLHQEWIQSTLAEMYKNIKIGQLSAWEAALHISSKGPFRQLQNPWVFWIFKILPTSIAKLLLAPLMTHSSTRDSMTKDRLWIKNQKWDKIYSARASLAKFAASDAALENCKLGLRILGQMGFRNENRIEKILRDVKLLQIYEGTNQLNRINLFKQEIGLSLQQVRVFEE